MAQRFTTSILSERYNNHRRMQDNRPQALQIVNMIINLEPGYGVETDTVAVGVFSHEKAFVYDFTQPEEKRKFLHFPIEWLEKSAVVGLLFNDYINQCIETGSKPKLDVKSFVNE